MMPMGTAERRKRKRMNLREQSDEQAIGQREGRTLGTNRELKSGNWSILVVNSQRDSVVKWDTGVLDFPAMVYPWQSKAET